MTLGKRKKNAMMLGKVKKMTLGKGMYFSHWHVKNTGQYIENRLK